MSTLGVLRREAYFKGVPEPLEQEVFQYGQLFLRKLPAQGFSDGGGGSLKLLYELRISTNDRGSNPKGLVIDEREYNLPWPELVRVMYVQANLNLVEGEYREAGKIPRL